MKATIRTMQQDLEALQKGVPVANFVVNFETKLEGDGKPTATATVDRPLLKAMAIPPSRLPSVSPPIISAPKIAPIAPAPAIKAQPPISTTPAIEKPKVSIPPTPILKTPQIITAPLPPPAGASGIKIPTPPKLPPPPTPTKPVAPQTASTTKGQKQFLDNRYKTFLSEANSLFKNGQIQEASLKLAEAQKIKPTSLGFKLLSWRIKRSGAKTKRIQSAEIATAQKAAAQVKKDELILQTRQEKELRQKQEAEQKQQAQSIAQQQAEQEKLKLATERAKAEQIRQQQEQMLLAEEQKRREAELARQQETEQNRIEQLRLAEENRQKTPIERVISNQVKVEPPTKPLPSPPPSLPVANQWPPISVAPPKPQATTTQPTYAPIGTPDITAKPQITPNANRNFLLRKILVSGIATVILAILVTLGWMYFNNKKPIEPTPSPTETVPVGQAPQSLIKPDGIITIEVDQKNSLKQQLDSLLNREYPQGRLQAIVIKKIGGYLLTPKEISDELNLSIPSNVLGSLGGKTTLYLYTQKEVSSSPFIAGYGQNRLALVANVKDQTTALEALSSWQKTMPNDLISLLPLKKIPASTKSLTPFEYQSINIFYVNLPDATLALNYTITNNLLLIGTSRETMYTLIKKAK